MASFCRRSARKSAAFRQSRHWCHFRSQSQSVRPRTAIAVLIGGHFRVAEITDYHRSLNSNDNSHQASKKRRIVTDSWTQKKTQAPTHTSTNFCPIKGNVCRYFNSATPPSNPTQPPRDGFKHLMIGWRKLSAKGTAQCVAVSLFLVRIYAARMGRVAPPSPLGSGSFEGGTLCRWSRVLIGCWGWRDFFVCTCEALGLVLLHRSSCPRLPLRFLWIFFGGALCCSNLLGWPRPVGCETRRPISIQTPAVGFPTFF